MKKIPLKYWAMIAGAFVLLVLGVLTVSRVFVNASYVNRYDAGDYDTAAEEKLIYVNYLESYVVYYNLGNAAYQEGDYLKAAGLYAEALKYNAPEGDDCQIRINYALSLCYSIDYDNLETQSDIENALTILYAARDALTVNGCANDEGTGHNSDAQQLKEDIDKMIEKLENPDNENNEQDQEENQDQEQDQENNDQNDQQNQSQSSKQKEQQEKLQQNKQNAQKERREEQQAVEEFKKENGIGEDEEGQGGGDGDENGNGGGSSGTNPW